MQQWQPSATIDTLRARARMLSGIRDFFDQRDLLEVSTPVLSAAAATDPALDSLTATVRGVGPRWLHTSPEFAMKRLLAAGSGDIWQVCPVFRDGEQGRWHNPEFTLVEWYRLGFDERQLAAEVVALIETLAIDYRDLATAQYLSYRDAFVRYAGIDPLTASDDEISEAAMRMVATGGPVHWQRSDWLDLLGSAVVYPALGRGCVTVLTDYPAAQAALARIRPGNPPSAARFEVFLDGVELANGFYELADSQEQRRRFEVDLKRRRETDMALVAPDERLLAALEYGLPDCAGVALGLDRLVALLLGHDSLARVMTFDFTRA